MVVDEIEGSVYEQDCMNHLRCIWLNGTAKVVSGFMTTHLQDLLNNILSFLRVSPDLAYVNFPYHKEFSLTANYPKGHGKKFDQIQDLLIILRYSDTLLQVFPKL